MSTSVNPLLFTRYEDLSEDKRMRALDNARNTILGWMVDCSTGDTFEKYQEVIDACFESAEGKETPWFIGEYLMEAIEYNKGFKKLFEAEALKLAQTSVYVQAGVRVVQL